MTNLDTISTSTTRPATPVIRTISAVATQASLHNQSASLDNAIETLSGLANGESFASDVLAGVILVNHRVRHLHLTTQPHLQVHQDVQAAHHQVL